jgi:ribosomal protein L6P/L9E
MCSFKLFSTNLVISSHSLSISGPVGTVSFPPISAGRFLPHFSSFAPFFSELRSAQVGVEVGFYARLSLNGVGFRAWNFGRLLLLDLGYTTLFVYTLPKSVVPVFVKKSNLILLSPSLSLLQTVVSQLVALRPVDLYKGKGVRDFGSSVNLKKRKKDGK